MERIPDEYGINRCLCSGYAHPLKSAPTCPICGEEVDTYLKNADGEVVGCEYCIKGVDAWEECEE